MNQNKVAPATTVDENGDSRCERIVGCLGVKQWVLLLFLFLYSLMGGAVMRELESDAWLQRKVDWNTRIRQEEINLARNVALFYANNLSCSMVEYNNTNSTLLQEIVSHHETLDIYDDVTVDHWRLMEATWYAFTVVTTIGELQCFYFYFLCLTFFSVKFLNLMYLLVVYG